VPRSDTGIGSDYERAAAEIRQENAWRPEHAIRGEHYDRNDDDSDGLAGLCVAVAMVNNSEVTNGTQTESLSYWSD
jgi:hypothetical protein